jgi:hypothetical protein
MLASLKPEFRRHPPLAKQFLTERNYPWWLSHLKNHHIWYELRFSTELDEFRIAPALT